MKQEYIFEQIQSSMDVIYFFYFFIYCFIYFESESCFKDGLLGGSCSFDFNNYSRLIRSIYIFLLF